MVPAIFVVVFLWICIFLVQWYDTQNGVSLKKLKIISNFKSAKCVLTWAKRRKNVVVNMKAVVGSNFVWNRANTALFWPFVEPKLTHFSLFLKLLESRPYWGMLWKKKLWPILTLNIMQRPVWPTYSESGGLGLWDSNHKAFFVNLPSFFGSFFC